MCDGLVDHVSGFQTVEVRSNPARCLLTVCLSSLFLFTYIVVVFLGCVVIKHKILFTNFACAEFECIFLFVSLLFISLL